MKATACFFLAILITYLAAAFIMWGFNPETWNVWARAATAVVGVMAASVFAAANYES